MEEEKKHKLGRVEASMVVRWLKNEKGREVNGGWTAIWKRTPDQVAKDYNVTAKEVREAARIDEK